MAVADTPPPTQPPVAAGPAIPNCGRAEAQRRGRPARGAKMWTLPWRRAPARAGASLVGDLLGPRLVLGQESTNEWMGFSCRASPPPRLYHGRRPCFLLEGAGRSPGRGLV